MTMWQVSSVGRAGDWKSPCPQFDSGTGHHFFALMPDGDTPFGFFLVLFWGWIARIYDFFSKTENLKSRHSEDLKSVKIPEILRLAIFGDTGICQVVTAWYAKKILQNYHCFSLFSSKCNGEFLYTNRSPLGIIFTNQRVTTKTEIFVLLTNAHQKKKVLCHHLLFCIGRLHNKIPKHKQRTGIAPDALFCFIWLILSVKTSSVLPSLPEVRFWVTWG